MLNMFVRRDVTLASGRFLWYTTLSRRVLDLTGQSWEGKEDVIMLNSQ